MHSGELIVNGISIVILAALALLPFVNFAVGTIVGGSLAGPVGLCVGALIALLITAAEVKLLQSGTSLASPSAGAMKIIEAVRLNRTIVSLADRRLSMARLASWRSAKSQEREAA
jgi:hypothetical protein